MNGIELDSLRYGCVVAIFWDHDRTHDAKRAPAAP